MFPPEPTVPEPERVPTGVHPALNTEVKKWGLIPAVAAGLSAVLGTGGIIAFLISFASTVRAESRAAAHEESTIVAQRMDHLKADGDATKLRLEAIDAGVSRDIRRLEQKIDDNAKRLEQKVDDSSRDQRAMMGELLREIRKK